MLRLFKKTMSFQITLVTLFLYTFFFPCHMTLLNPNSTTTLNPFFPSESSSSSSSHSSTTIPAFPEKSNLQACPLTLSNELFDGIKNACGHGSNSHPKLHYSNCCPVLAAWLYSAYSSTSLGNFNHSSSSSSSSSYDMPLMPDDSETCVNGLEKALKVRGIKLTKPNETCDLVYCYCGIRLHPFSCPDAFSVNQNGELVGDESVRRLEKSCLSSSTNVNGFSGLGRCSKCLKSLYLLNKKTSNSSKGEEQRTTKIHNRDCELMGLTWLLSKNRTAYIHTVTGVLRALLLKKDGSDPKSCALNSDGMPLAVDSTEIYDHSSSINLQQFISFSLLLLCFVFYYVFMLMCYPSS